jgi:membrane protease YdiL (CAAX protease family)
MCERRLFFVKIPAFEKTNMLTPTPKERLTARPVVVLLLFLVTMIAAEFGRALLQFPCALLISNSLTGSTSLLISLFATTATVGAVLVYCLAIERRTFASLGFIRRGAVAEYAVGLAAGLGLLGLPVLLCVVTGAITLSPAESMPSFGLVLLFFVGFLIQGMSEEMLCRSYLMISLSRKWPLWVCAVTNALLFSLLHLGNPGVTAIALINIFLFGLFASLLTLRRGSIWMVGAVHSMWNFAQGNLFGIPVSGLAGCPSPLVTEMGEGKWQTLAGGGSFGLEGGLAVTVVLAVACAVVWIASTKKSEVVTEVNE